MKSLHIAVVLVAFALAPYILPDPLFPNTPQELPIDLQKWYNRGEIATINGNKLFYIHNKCSDPSVTDPPTFAILHGFPSSSFEYYKVIDTLLRFGDVVVHDQVGFGLSDKPTTNYTYSLSEAADNTLILWRKLKIKEAHVIAHDMGDSVLTEILARRHRGLLPGHFDHFFKSVTFTNGGMKYSLINFRFSQTLGGSRLFGSYFVKLSSRYRLSPLLSTRQLRSVWGPNANSVERDEDIAYIAELIQYKGGNLLMNKLMYYLWDRAHFEFRWFSALREIDIPIRFVWADSDAVSPVAIPQYFQSFVPGMTLTLVKDAGHFFVLEKPGKWMEVVIKPLISS